MSSDVRKLGDEELLVERAVRAVVDAARSVDPDVELRRFRAPETTSADLAAALSPSLFAEARVIVLEGAHEAGKDASAAILDQATAPGEGVTVVVSPLIALQEDQVAGFDEISVGRAVSVNSARGVRARREALRRVAAGEAQFVLLGTEQLRNADVIDVLMGDQHAIERRRAHAQPGQPLLDAPRRDAGVDQQPRRPGIDQKRISAAAARQRDHPHRSHAPSTCEA